MSDKVPPPLPTTPEEFRIKRYDYGTPFVRFVEKCVAILFAVAALGAVVWVFIWATH